jgi:hypothetical protein
MKKVRKFHLNFAQILCFQAHSFRLVQSLDSELPLLLPTVLQFYFFFRVLLLYKVLWEHIDQSKVVSLAD